MVLTVFTGRNSYVAAVIDTKEILAPVLYVVVGADAVKFGSISHGMSHLSCAQAGTNLFLFRIFARFDDWELALT